jgi:hypothetical protein
MHTCVGLTIYCVEFSSYLGSITLPSDGGSLVIGGGSVPMYTYVKERGGPTADN